MSKDSTFRRLKAEVLSGEGAKRKLVADALMGRLFQQQKDLILDPSRRKALRCPRRSGKTFAAASYLVYQALTESTTNAYFITSTRAMAKDILWKGADSSLKKFNDDFELGMHFHNTNLIATFPWGSTITLTGADTRNDVDKLRGQAYSLVIVDECKNFSTQLLTELIEEVISPALQDRQGTLVLMGTPGNVLSGPFYDATHDGSPIAEPYDGDATEKRYSFHTWTVQDNVAIPHLWDGFIQEKKAYGWTDDEPKWRREYLGQWVSDRKSFVYPYSEERDSWSGDLPRGHHWNHTLGIRMSAEHDSAFAVSVCAYSDTHENFYHIHDEIYPYQTVGEIAGHIRRLEGEFGEFVSITANTTAKQLVNELQSVHAIPIDEHFGKDRKEYIALIGDNMRAGNFKVRRGTLLEREMQRLVWGEDGQEAEGLDHAVADSVLYQYKYSHHRFFTPRKKNTKDPVQLGIQKDIRKYLHQKRLRDESSWWESGLFEKYQPVSDDDYSDFEAILTGELRDDFGET